MYHIEKKIYMGDGISNPWKTWFKILDKDDDRYIPLHICFLLLDEDDWRVYDKKISLAKIIRVAIKLSQKLR